ncbi:MAG TPA: helix-hairpin-helix domain-containing protein [Vicinamibacteria bacterium]|jgi:putative hydrolase
MAPATNQQVADKLLECAVLLEQQAASPFRVRAYRRAAAALERSAEDVHALLRREGRAGLQRLPGIGPSIAAAIEEMLRTGRWSQLHRLRGTLDPPRLFRAVPGLGPVLAARLHDRLQVDTLEALEVAAHDGRLADVPGVGERRAAVIRAGLQALLGRPRAAPRGPRREPPVALLLDVDAEYRRRAARGDLPRIAPRRFNPAGEAWLPVLHTERGRWRFTALFSNTARAHDLGRTRDWVVVYFQRGSGPEGQRTVVTERHGTLLGRRVVRGREADCAALPAHAAAS